MAGPKKQKKLNNPIAQDNDSDSGGENSDSYNGQEMIDVTFEGRNLEIQDHHGIKQLLQQLFLKMTIDVTELAEILIAQEGIGSVLKQSFDSANEMDEDDDDLLDDHALFGVTSVIDLTTNQGMQSIKQFTNLLRETSQKYADNDTQIFIDRLFSENHKIAFLVNERFINIPSKISDSLLTSLHGELERIKRKNVAYRFDYFILIARAWKPKTGADTEMIYCKDEEELFAKNAEFTYGFNISDQLDTGVDGNWSDKGKQLIQHRKVIIFKSEKFNEILNQIRTFLQTIT